MKEEIRNCQNCKNDFKIESDDFSFYEKIKVPPPTFCPECRMIRRMMWRNVRSLNKRECFFCNKNLISMYSERDGVPVVCTDCFFGNKWDPFIYGKDYDFSRPFFEQLKNSINTIPRLYSYKFGNLVNSEYTNFSKDNKNAYLCYSAVGNEDVMYGEVIDASKNTLDSYAVLNVQGCYYNVDCEANYNTHYAIKSNSCLDSLFLFDCVNCTNCFMSYNLRNQKYFYKNKKYSKEEYEKILSDYELNTYTGFEKAIGEFDYLVKNKSINKYSFIYSVQNVTGDHIHNAKNIKRCFDTNDSENVFYGCRVIGVKDSMDLQGVGFNAELIYESMAATNNTSKDSFCYITIEGCSSCEYSLILKNCSHCFACIGLINANYCIFNKQYEKEEYFETVDKIKKHMNKLPYVDGKDRIWKYGEFFPYDLSPFGINETNAHDCFNLTKEEAVEKGYSWRDKEKKDYKCTINSEVLLNDILDVKDDILNQIISCPNDGNQMYQCSGAYRIMPFELQFLRDKKLPIPRYCPNCRHYQRLRYRNLTKLYHRSCMKEGCTNEFETSYAPDRPEIVYCESCYRKEVY